MKRKEIGDFSAGDQRSKETAVDGPVVHGPMDNLTPEELAACQIWGMKIALAAKRGNRDGAYELVDFAIGAMKGESGDSILQTTLADMGVDVRSCNSLEKERGILTVDDVLQAHVGDLLAIPNFGPMGVIGLFSQVTKFCLGRTMDLERRLAESVAIDSPSPNR